MSSTDRPDLVFLGATVETMTDDARPADAVAVRDGRIVSSGARRTFGPWSDRERGSSSSTASPSCQGSRTRISTRSRAGCSTDLRPPRPARCGGLPRAVSAHASSHPRPPWITGSGWPLTAFPRGEPTARARCDRPRPAGPAREQRWTLAWANSSARIGGYRSRDTRSAGWPHRSRRPRRSGRHAAR